MRPCNYGGMKSTYLAGGLWLRCGLVDVVVVGGPVVPAADGLAVVAAGVEITAE